MEAFVLFFIFSFDLGLMALWIYLIVEIIQSQFPTDTDRILWLLLVVLLPFVGSIIYLIVGREKRLSKHSSNEMV